MINVVLSVKILCVQGHCVYKNYYIKNPALCSCKNGKYSASITDNLVITCDEIVDAGETKTVTTNLNEKK